MNRFVNVRSGVLATICDAGFSAVSVAFLLSGAHGQHSRDRLRRVQAFFLGTDPVLPVEGIQRAADGHKADEQHQRHGHGKHRPAPAPPFLHHRLDLLRPQFLNRFLYNCFKSRSCRPEGLPEIFRFLHASNTSSLQMLFSCLRPRFSLDFTVPCGIRRMDAICPMSYPSR